MSLETLLEECADRGWLLNNLFQHDDTSWQCNLRTVTHYAAYGLGPTAEIALSVAMDEMETNPLEAKAPLEVSHIDVSGLESTQPASIDINAILRSLRPPTPAVFRRKL